MSEYIVVTTAPEHIPSSVNVAVPFQPFNAGYPHARPLHDYANIRQLTRSRDQKLYVMMPDLILEHQLETLDAFLPVILDSDGVYYGDEAVFMTLRSMGYEGLMIYQPETLACSGADICTMQQWGANVVSLAHELSLDEIVSIAAEAENLEVLIHGWYPVLYSGRRLVSNYGQAIGKTLTDGIYSIQESTRQDKLPLVQQETGTILFGEGPMESGEVMDRLKEAGISRFRIDGRFMTCEELENIILFYTRGQGQVSGHNDWYHKESLIRKEKS